MKLSVFAIFDEKAKAFMPPFCMHNVSVAVRSFGNEVNRGGSQVGTNPEDYTLFRLADFEDTDGKLTPCTPEALANGLQVRQKPLV